MSIKSSTVYVTSDGNQHATRAAALKHEAGLKVRKGLEENYKVLAPGRMPSEFSVNLLNDPKKLEEMRDLCNAGLNYHRNYGLLRKK